jgi:hypothetical protein
VSVESGEGDGELGVQREGRGGAQEQQRGAQIVARTRPLGKSSVRHGLMTQSSTKKNNFPFVLFCTLARQTDAERGCISRAVVKAWQASRKRRKPEQAKPSCSRTVAEGLPRATTRVSKSRQAARSLEDN